MRLENISLKNFRAIESSDIRLDGKSTVIFGINGTGKSSILRSIGAEPAFLTEFKCRYPAYYDVIKWYLDTL